MPDRIANILVLVEDVEQQNLVRRYLQRCGHTNFRFAPLPAKSSGASGEKYVRDTYPMQVKACRSVIGKRTSAILIVMVDADRETVHGRQTQLATALHAATMAPRSNNEPIVILIPKRHVETWIRALQGEQVDEQTDYKHPKPIAGQIKISAERVYELARPNVLLPTGLPPSLVTSIPEWRKIP